MRKGGSGEAQFSGQSWIQLAPIEGKILFRPPVSVQMCTHVGFGFTTAQANHAAQADSPQIKPGGGSALFLELIKWRTCCSRQFWTAWYSVWTLAEHKRGEEFWNYAGCRPSLGYIESAYHCMNAGIDSHLISLQCFFPNHVCSNIHVFVWQDLQAAVRGSVALTKRTKSRNVFEIGDGVKQHAR